MFVLFCSLLDASSVTPSGAVHLNVTPPPSFNAGKASPGDQPQQFTACLHEHQAPKTSIIIPQTRSYLLEGAGVLGAGL